MNLQAYLDESESDGVFVLGGYMGTAESWANFSRIWEGLLRHHGTVDDDGRYHFKMSEMAAEPERMKRVPVFFYVIEEHVLGWMSVTFRLSLLRLLDTFQANRASVAELIPPDRKFDFYFDNKTERKFVYATWANHLAKLPKEISQLYGKRSAF